MKIDIRTKQFGRHFSHIEEDVRPLSVQERRHRRAALFAETAMQRLRRTAAMVGACAGFGARGLWGAADQVLRERAIAVAGLPDPANASAQPEGLCGLIAAATPEALIEGYARGLHAAAPFGLLAWWSPRVTMAVAPNDFIGWPGGREKLCDSKLDIALDTDFDAVLKACAHTAPMPPRLMHLFASLHDMGFAHCIEVRSASGHRVASAWGLALGQVFITIGAFGAEHDDRDFALSQLNCHLAQQNFALHVAMPEIGETRLGFAAMARTDYFAALIAHSGYGRLGRWQWLAGVSDGERLAA